MTDEHDEQPTPQELAQEAAREAAYRLLEAVATDLEARVKGRKVDEVVDTAEGRQVVQRTQYASASELNVAVAFLKNNGIEMTPEQVKRKAPVLSVPFKDARSA